MSVKASEKKPSIFTRLGRKFKEVASELKKVTWPTFSKTLKTTGVVCAVVLFFLIAIGLSDMLLGWLAGLVTNLGN